MCACPCNFTLKQGHGLRGRGAVSLNPVTFTNSTSVDEGMNEIVQKKVVNNGALG